LLPSVIAAEVIAAAPTISTISKEDRMLDDIWTHLRSLLEVAADPAGPDAASMAMRTIVVYAFTLAIVRLGSRRLLSTPSAFDMIVAIMVGSIMSRAINGDAPFVPTLLAGAILILTHWAFAVAAVGSHRISVMVKGSRIALIRDGELLRDAMRRAHVTDDDLAEALRLQIHDDDPSRVAAAYMERSGDISVIPRRGG
jgi:uncharacterized membrane protein YcaP (DUF421 family)